MTISGIGSYFLRTTIFPFQDHGAPNLCVFSFKLYSNTEYSDRSVYGCDAIKRTRSLKATSQRWFLELERSDINFTTLGEILSTSELTPENDQDIAEDFGLRYASKSLVYDGVATVIPPYYNISTRESNGALSLGDVYCVIDERVISEGQASTESRLLRASGNTYKQYFGGVVYQNGKPTFSLEIPSMYPVKGTTITFGQSNVTQLFEIVHDPNDYLNLDKEYMGKLPFILRSIDEVPVPAGGGGS